MSEFLHKKLPFSQVPNRALFDENLSLEAKGLYCTLWALNENEKLSDVCNENDFEINSAIKELQDNGYLNEEDFK